jgi:hypothetical protein
VVKVARGLLILGLIGAGTYLTFGLGWALIVAGVLVLLDSLTD